MRPPPNPALYQVNTRVRLTERARALGRPATLDDLPDADLDRLAERGFGWVWLLGVWRTGLASRRASRESPALRREFRETLPDLVEDDIAGSGFAIAGYTVDPALGGDAALARLRARLAARGLSLMLDFVPNHTGLDHPWVEAHPEYYVAGTEADLLRAPRSYAWVGRPPDRRLLAHGRDPHFDPWSDTLQLDYSSPATQAAMLDELLEISGRCDGVRCDMAMLLLPDVFERTWGRRAPPFWGPAIRRVRERTPGFTFLAEVYWDLEWAMLEEGFDYAYDKRLYDRLREGRARPVREHLSADPGYQAKLARFLENHDEPRAAATFAPGQHEAAAVLTYLAPGLRFFHDGQLEGRRVRISPHLVRAPAEPVDEPLRGFYEALLAALRQEAVREGRWTLLPCAPAWEGNESGDGFVAFAWHDAGAGVRCTLVAVNYAPTRGQCYVRLPFEALAGAAVRLRDLTGDAVYDRSGDDLLARGLYLDVPAWGRHVFDVSRTP